MDREQNIAPPNPKDEVLRKVGRNLLIFQQIESLLKMILGNSKVQGYVRELAFKQEQRINGMQKDMMGQLIQRYFDEILSSSDEEPQRPRDLMEPWLSSSFKIAVDAVFAKNQLEAFEMMREERNRLVHHFLPYWQSDSPENLIQTSDYLDKQREKILPVWDHLKFVAKTMQQARQELASYMGSNEFDQQLKLLWLQQSLLIQLFCDIAMQIGRADRWACLTYAGKLVHMQLANDVAQMNATYGYHSFKKLLIASGQFEIWDKALPYGGSRTFYRIRPDHN
ncbi:hypothetical protein [Nitrosomonas supralitoralis]|uniref:HTH OST-type domain-containing protein n=1 Tax=Nitrosomonas supralitoralis TaxID=2116706 RepID=A0A2P7NVP6_9PROT|nr:hypothetical protein [Nitrosomonas supralitoralis]PSJ17518.1 hypothetical protein C7H79_07450 [Nitrosomonas supralitoralis]